MAAMSVTVMADVGLSKRRQQELLALGKIRGESVVVIHNDHCSIDSFRLGKTIVARIVYDAAISPLTTAPAAQIETSQQSQQLFVVEFYARWAVGWQFKDAAFESLVPNAKPVPIQYKILIRFR